MYIYEQKLQKQVCLHMMYIQFGVVRGLDWTAYGLIWLDSVVIASISSNQLVFSVMSENCSLPLNQVVVPTHLFHVMLCVQHQLHNLIILHVFYLVPDFIILSESFYI